MALAIIVPISLHLGGPAATGGLVLGDEADGAFIGRSLSQVNGADPPMGAFLVTFMDTMCAFMMAIAVSQIGIAWFALRRAQPWALWTASAGNLVIVPYYLVIGATFTQRGAPAVPGVIGALVPTVLAAAAVAIGWVGIRQ